MNKKIAKQQANSAALRTLDVKNANAIRDLDEVLPGLNLVARQRLSKLLVENGYCGDIDHLKQIVWEEASKENAS